MLSLLILATAQSASAFDPGPSPRLMRSPTLSATTIVFQFAGDLWTVPRTGGRASRLTSAAGTESNPRFSPDGKRVAFSGQYDGNTDVFVVPAEGGVPKRLTAHPDTDRVLGWSPDGKSVLFGSSMLSNTDHPRLYTVGVTGGVPKALPFPSAWTACFSPDGAKIAYTPRGRTQAAWKRYRGGQTGPIWIGNLADSKVTSLPHANTNDERPMWVGESIYFLSDKRGPVGLSRFDTKSRRITEEIVGEGFDIKSADAGPGAIVYEKLGSLNLYDLKSRKSSRLQIDLDGDFPEVRPQFKDVQNNVASVGISPTGQRLVAAARGWIFTVPAAKGDARQIGSTQGVHRRDPAWSPDGRTIAFLTDEADVQELALHDVTTGTERRLPLGDPPAFYESPVWSPDSSKVAYTDNRLALWVLDVKTGRNTKIDTGTYRGGTQIQPNWSPDSKWLTWSRDLDNHLQAVFVHHLDSAKTTQITDGMAHSWSPSFDRDGKHLYFLASTNAGVSADIQDIANFNSPNVTSSVYAVVLRKDGPNPLHPESDEETVKDPTKKEEPKKDQSFRIDVEGIERRIIALPMPSQGYRGLEAGPAGSFFVMSSPPRATATSGGEPPSLLKFTLADRKSTPFASGVNGYTVSADGSKILLLRGRSHSIVPTAAPAAPGQGTVDFSGLRVRIDPRQEWRRMYREVWRNQRMLFYDPKMHGLDTVALERRYDPFLENIASRGDLNYLLTDMLGELNVGHMYISGGDIPGTRTIPGGLLGVDFTFENGRYRLTRVYDGERWNPGLYAPMAQPGINAQAGEYLLEIDGKELNDAIDIYETLEGKAGRQVKVKLGPNPNGDGAREVVVVPVGNDYGLRQRAWAEDNRRKVEKMTGGKVGYVHVPDTSSGGWEAFNRYYYAQAGKSGMVIDDRFNHGGAITGFFVREMTKTMDFGSRTRYGKDWQIPPAAVYGPKVMIIDELAGSGGDIFPYLFRLHGVGKLVGKRTWGAMISNYGFNLIDGGRISSPDDALYDPVKGEWVIEGPGVAPDIDVELDPFLWRQGRDAQLEAAVAEVQRRLAKESQRPIRRPDYPNKSGFPRY
jgi:tricorn protease